MKTLEQIKASIASALNESTTSDLERSLSEVTSIKELYAAIDLHVEKHNFSVIKSLALKYVKLKNQEFLSNAIEIKYHKMRFEILDILSSILPESLRSDMLDCYENLDLDDLKDALKRAQKEGQNQAKIAKFVTINREIMQDQADLGTNQRKNELIDAILRICHIYSEAWLYKQDVRFIEFLHEQVMLNQAKSLNLEKRFEKELINLEKIDDEAFFIHEVKLLKSRLKTREIKLFLSFLIDLDKLLLRDRIAKILKGI